MTDSEKLALIDMMIADFWEGFTFEHQEKSAFCLVNAIASVVNFKGKDDSGV